MLVSMTGFGRANQTNQNQSVTVEVKSVNHRFFDVTFNHSREFLHLENEMKRLVKAQINRGVVTVQITVTGARADHAQLNINWPLLDQYINEMKSIQRRYSLKDDLKTSDLLQIQDVFSLNESERQSDGLDERVLECLNQSLETLSKMRRQEGQHLYDDLSNRLKLIESQISFLKQRAPGVVQDYRERLETRMKEFLDERADIDEERLLNEVAIFTDKANIDEELTRLESHTQQFLAVMNENIQEPKGRKLDFLIQEMNREINTIGSKANDVEIAQAVVDVKSEIEKMREQAQNIE